MKERVNQNFWLRSSPSILLIFSCEITTLEWLKSKTLIVLFLFLNGNLFWSENHFSIFPILLIRLLNKHIYVNEFRYKIIYLYKRHYLKFAFVIFSVWERACYYDWIKYTPFSFLSSYLNKNQQHLYFMAYFFRLDVQWCFIWWKTFDYYRLLRRRNKIYFFHVNGLFNTEKNIKIFFFKCLVWLINIIEKKFVLNMTYNI